MYRSCYSRYNAFDSTHKSFNRDPEEIADFRHLMSKRRPAISGGERSIRSPPEIASTNCSDGEFFRAISFGSRLNEGKMWVKTSSDEFGYDDRPPDADLGTTVIRHFLAVQLLGQGKRFVAVAR